jgi:hypothetical protein
MVLGGTDILSWGQARVRGLVGHLRIIETNPAETNVRRASPREAVDATGRGAGAGARTARYEP